MGRITMNNTAVDFSDVQGLVRFGYGKMRGASYALLRIKNSGMGAARAWLQTALRTGAIATAEAQRPAPSTALQVAFTRAGLEALGIPQAIVDGFSPEFLAGMGNSNRARRLGDIAANDPSQWDWGYGVNAPHLVVMFFANPKELAPLIQTSKGNAWTDGFEEIQWLGTADLDGVEPFGFTDGISQPEIDWAQTRDVNTPQLDYTNVVALGEFLLGYRNEYDKFTTRPLVDPDPVSRRLLDALGAPGKKDVGRNGTYLVMRQLEQDVRGFWHFARKQAGGDEGAAERLAQAFIGRTRQGSPLVRSQEKPIPGVGSDPDDVCLNQFTFAKDPAGMRCPFGAHVHRANPRNTDYPGRPTGLEKLVTMLGFGPRGFRDDLMSAVRFHRILRRGREYGPGLPPYDADEPAPLHDPNRGLHFVCLNANISRQFEFLQNAWINSNKFSGLTGESDPLLGNREALPGCPFTDGFTQPQKDGAPQHRSRLPQFVTVKGGAYFFLPSLSALRFFAAIGNTT
ncbi:MAG: Dyp-type peroxidase [Chthoniobacterales bacterium]